MLWHLNTQMLLSFCSCPLFFSPLYGMILCSVLRPGEAAIFALANGDPDKILKPYWVLSCELWRGPKMTADNRTCTGLRSQWMIFSLCSICRHRRRAWVNRRMRARLKPWKLFFLMSSYKFTLKKQTHGLFLNIQHFIFFLCMHMGCTGLWNKQYCSLH